MKIQSTLVARRATAPRLRAEWFAILLPWVAGLALAQSTPQMVDSNLGVRAAVTGLTMPTSMAFLGTNDFLVLEKASGKVKRVTNGSVAATVLDLAVNSGSERGLLGIALHPNFPATPWVYLYWTESTTGTRPRSTRPRCSATASIASCGMGRR
jgi:glucose/arabinose dehydrogenase